MRFAGIDPGLSGGMFVYDTNTEFVSTFRFSGTDSILDIHDFCVFLMQNRPEHVVLEKIFLAGREGGSSAMTIGINYGRILACLDVFSPTKYTEVAPRVWQKALGLKGGSRAITKQAASDLAVKRFGESVFLQGRARKPHDGLTDAACMALYALQLESESLWDEPEKKSTKSTQSSARNTDTSASKSSPSKAKKKSSKRLTTKTSNSVKSRKRA
jgi:crossover junction endodeoxyribonuclease RuvC